MSDPRSPGTSMGARSSLNHLQLKWLLVADIRAERVEGDLLPSESQLGQRYGVSSTVVPQALGRGRVS
jgi:DNA-binding GntR family transcriptional regulator